MKLTIERAAFLKALSHTQSLVERRTTIPIVSNVLLRAEASRLALSATDMDLEIVERVESQIRREGQQPFRRTHFMTSSASCERGRRSKSKRARSATR